MDTSARHGADGSSPSEWLPAPRSSPDRRTVLLPDTDGMPEAVGLAEASGWHLASASRTADGVLLVLQR